MDFEKTIEPAAIAGRFAYRKQRPHKRAEGGEPLQRYAALENCNLAEAAGFRPGLAPASRGKHKAVQVLRGGVNRFAAVGKQRRR